MEARLEHFETRPTKLSTITRIRSLEAHLDGLILPLVPLPSGPCQDSPAHDQSDLFQSALLPTTHLASEAATARFEQAFVNEHDRFPTVGSSNKDTLGTP